MDGCTGVQDRHHRGTPRRGRGGGPLHASPTSPATQLGTLAVKAAPLLRAADPAHRGRPAHREADTAPAGPPLDRLLDAGVLCPTQEAELIAYRDDLSPKALARQINDLQARLVVWDKDKTDQL